MKKTILSTMLIVVCTLFCACSLFHEPRCMNERAILLDVYNKTWYNRSDDEIGFSFLCGQFCPELSDEEILENIHVINWEYNRSTQGDSYEGYFVTYSVNIKDDVLYSLVDLVEFENGRYEWTVLETSSSLSAIQNLLSD